MNQQEASKQLENRIRVTRQQVVIAKGYIINNFNPNPKLLIQSLLKAVETGTAENLTIHLLVDTDANIKAVADVFSWTLAACEAIWGLIGVGHLIPTDSRFTSVLPNVAYSTDMRGSGERGGLDTSQFYAAAPNSLMLAPSVHSGERQVLSDPDLFLHAMEVNGMEKDVEDSLREAVRCFRHELFLAALAMLGRASEGAWIDLGMKLCAVAPAESPLNVSKLKDELEDPFIGIGKKISKVVQLYQQKGIFGRLYTTSGVKPSDLQNIHVWADAVRDARNSIHYGTASALPNTYEKVAALLIGAVPHLRLIYRICVAAAGN